MPLAVLLVAFPCATDVIAAPTAMDQPPVERGGLLPGLLFLALAPLAVGVMLRFRWYRLARVPLRPEVTPPPLSFVFVLLMFAFGAFGLQLAMRVFAIDPGDGSGDVTLTLAEQTRLSAGAYAGQTLVALAYLRLRGRTRRGAVAGTGTGRAVLLGLAAFLLWWPIVSAVGWVAAIVRVWMGAPPPDAVSHETLRLLVDSPRDGWFGLLVLLVVIAAPALEELLYRGLFQDALRRLGLPPWPAIVLVSVVFAAMHWSNTEPHAVAGLAVLSVGFGWVFERTGRLVAPIAMHAAFNAANLVVALGA